MRFEFKGQTYEVSENDVMFTCDENNDITGLEFREPIKEKKKWYVTLTTFTGACCSKPSVVLIKSEDYDACREVFAREKNRLVEELIMTTEDAYRFEVSGSSAATERSFNLVDLNIKTSYYLRLTKA